MADSDSSQKKAAKKKLYRKKTYEEVRKRLLVGSIICLSDSASKALIYWISDVNFISISLT